jgi:hypothetical protein
MNRFAQAHLSASPHTELLSGVVPQHRGFCAVLPEPLLWNPSLPAVGASAPAPARKLRIGRTNLDAVANPSSDWVAVFGACSRVLPVTNLAPQRWRSATVKQPHPLRLPTASVARSAVRPAANQWRRPETPGIAPPRSSRCRRSGRSSRARAETFPRRIVQQRRTRRTGRFPAPRAGPIVVGRGSVSPYPDSSRARGSGAIHEARA